jgi:hypothetical protein
MERRGTQSYSEVHTALDTRHSCTSCSRTTPTPTQSTNLGLLKLICIQEMHNSSPHGIVEDHKIDGCEESGPCVILSSHSRVYDASRIWVHQSSHNLQNVGIACEKVSFLRSIDLLCQCKEGKRTHAILKSDKNGVCQGEFCVVHVKGRGHAEAYLDHLPVVFAVRHQVINHSVLQRHRMPLLYHAIFTKILQLLSHRHEFQILRLLCLQVVLNYCHEVVDIAVSSGHAGCKNNGDGWQRRKLEIAVLLWYIGVKVRSCWVLVHDLQLCFVPFEVVRSRRRHCFIRSERGNLHNVKKLSDRHGLCSPPKPGTLEECTPLKSANTTRTLQVQTIEDHVRARKSIIHAHTVLAPVPTQSNTQPNQHSHTRFTKDLPSFRCSAAATPAQLSQTQSYPKVHLLSRLLHPAALLRPSQATWAQALRTIRRRRPRR